MSTNYYLIRKNNHHSRTLVKKALKDEDFERAKEIVNELDEGIHLGKRSSGWKWAVDYHDGRYFNKSVKSFIDFIKNRTESGEWLCIDEYRRPVTVEFIYNDIVGFSNGISMDDYIAKHPEERFIIEPKEEVVDGICRFCFYEDFS